MIAKSIQILESLQTPSGLCSASKQSVNTGYNRAWIRDNIYESLGLEAAKRHWALKRIYRAIFDVLLKHEGKIDAAIQSKPQHHYEYIHPRYDPHTLSEIWEEWGNRQNDAIGAFLYKVGDLESKGVKVIRDDDDRRILQKLVWYLDAIEYWHDEDNGVWEENLEIHASSVGACVAGLRAVRNLVDVHPDLLRKGEESLNDLLPYESTTKDADLALLSLVYPFNVVSDSQRDAILKNVEEKLVRQRGTIRYVGDKYYNRDGEAEWVMGFPWLAVIYKSLNRPDKYAHYMRKTIECANAEGELPELYYANSTECNENTPLGWTQALFLVAAMDE